MKLPEVETGDFVSLTDDREGEVFYGQISGIERSSQTGSITFSAMDMMKNLLESADQKNFKNITAEAIATDLRGCTDTDPIPVSDRYQYKIHDLR